MFTSTESSSHPRGTLRFVKRKCDKNSSSLKQILSWKVQQLDCQATMLHAPNVMEILRIPNYRGQLKTGWFLL